MIAGLSLAAVAAALTATVGLAIERWPVAMAADPGAAPRPAAPAAARSTARIVVQVDEAAAVGAAGALVAVILGAAALDLRRRFPTLR